jgi:hypothetical protein
MNPLYESHELMDDYLNGKLSAEEVMRFEQRLNSDPEFSELFEIHKVTNQVIVGQELINLKARMAKDLSSSASSSNFFNWKTWLGIATVTMAVVLYWWLKPSSNSNEGTAVTTKDTILILNQQKSILLDSASLQVKKDATPNEIVNPAVQCSDSIIYFSCQTRGTCRNSNDGAIEIDVNTIKSGIAPYTFSISLNGKFQSGTSIEGLAPGRYSLYVKDKGQCIRKLKSHVEVIAVDCN